MKNEAHIRPIYEVRWRNFRRLLDDRKLNLTASADLLGKLQGQVSHFGGKHPTKVIGDQIASEIEAAFDLPAGSLDLSHSDDGGVKSNDGNVGRPPQLQASDAPILAVAEKWLRFEEKGLGDPYRSQPERRAERLITLFQMIQRDGGQLTPEHAQELIDDIRRQEGAKTHGSTESRGKQ